jgi:hypothetical protein
MKMQSFVLRSTLILNLLAFIGPAQAEAEQFARQFRGLNRPEQPSQDKESTPPEKRENDQ